MTTNGLTLVTSGKGYSDLVEIASATWEASGASLTGKWKSPARDETTLHAVDAGLTITLTIGEYKKSEPIGPALIESEQALRNR